MSAAPASGAVPTAKATSTDKPTADATKDQKPAITLEEDDEFEDFPVETDLAIERTGLSPRGSSDDYQIESSTEVSRVKSGSRIDDHNCVMVSDEVQSQKYLVYG
ncbi:26S proteasome complex subunit [Ciborinia camelliae]|nr:26S proteasome complex subunit [Ciborinia camelliae]